MVDSPELAEHCLDVGDTFLALVWLYLIQTLRLNVLNVQLKFKHLLPDFIELLVHFFDEPLLLGEELFLPYLDPLVEGAWPVANVQKFLELLVREHYFQSVDEVHLIGKLVDLDFDVTYFVIRTLQIVDIIKQGDDFIDAFCLLVESALDCLDFILDASHLLQKLLSYHFLQVPFEHDAVVYDVLL